MQPAPEERVVVYLVIGDALAVGARQPHRQPRPVAVKERVVPNDVVGLHHQHIRNTVLVRRVRGVAESIVLEEIVSGIGGAEAGKIYVPVAVVTQPPVGCPI